MSDGLAHLSRNAGDVAAGRCTACHRRPPREGLKTCAECALRRSAAIKRRMEDPTYAAANRARVLAWQRRQPETKAAKCQRHRERLWQGVLDAYGRICVCCGETEEAFLTVDHIDGSGAAHRRATGARGSDFYRWLRDNGYPDDYRLLCWNCNCSRGIRGACPHETRRLAEAIA